MLKINYVDRTAPETASPIHPASVRWVLTSLSLAMLLSSLGTSIANVGLPSIAQAFGAPFGQVQWVVLAYLLAITTLIVSAGRLGDLFGRRRLLLAGILVFTLASGLSGVAPSLSLLIAARAVQGLGAALMLALSMALVSDAVPKEKTGSAMGLLGTMSAIGTALGPTLGGVLIAGFGWRAIFLASVPLGFLAMALAWRFLPDDTSTSPAARRDVDIVGTCLLALALTAYALAMTLGRGHFDRINVALLMGAAAGTALFIFAETKVPSPLVSLSMFRSPVLRAGLAASALVATVIMATLVVGPFYLSRALGLDAVQVGMVMSVGPILAAVFGVVAGRIVDDFGAGSAAIAGLAHMVAGSLALTVLPSLLGMWGYVVAIAILTPGYQLFQAANNTAVMVDVKPDQRGVISGMLNLSRNLGLVTGASVMGAVFAVASGARDVAAANAEAVASAMQVTFAVASVLLVLALAIAVRSLAAAKVDKRRATF